MCAGGGTAIYVTYVTLSAIGNSTDVSQSLVIGAIWMKKRQMQLAKDFSYLTF